MQANKKQLTAQQLQAKQSFEQLVGINFKRFSTYKQYKSTFFAILTDIEIGLDEGHTLLQAVKWFQTDEALTNYGVPKYNHPRMCVCGNYTLKSIVERVLSVYLSTIVKNLNIKRVPKCLQVYL